MIELDEAIELLKQNGSKGGGSYMTAKEKYIKSNKLEKLSKKQKDLIFAYEPWLSLDNCATSAVFQLTGKYDNDVFSKIGEYARQHAVLIYENQRHIGTVVDMRGWSDVE